ncbi:hypothetical protein [Rhodococcus sp. NPDC004095]
MSAMGRVVTLAGAATLVVLFGRRRDRTGNMSTGFGFGPNERGPGSGTDDFGYDSGADPDSDLPESGPGGQHGEA